MGLIRFILWTGVSVGIGIAAATVEIGGRTPVQHVERVWKHDRPQLERASRDAVDELKKKVSSKDTGPKEQHSASDRSAIDDIIAKRHP